MSMLELFDALDRLIQNKPTRVPKGTKISNDSVSLEAGRGKGSIKKSRPVYKKLIDAITIAAAEQETKIGPNPKERIALLKVEIEELKTLHSESLNREILLLAKLKDLEDELSKYKSGKITNIKLARNSTQPTRD